MPSRMADILRDMTYGVVHGRFQPLHNGHVEGLIMPASERCDFLVVGITNPSSEQTAFDATNPHRSEPGSNPFSYWERLIMVREALIERGIPSERFAIVPFPINIPSQLLNYVPRDATFYLTIYDDWGRKKQQELEGLGLRVEVLREMSLEEKGVSGTDIRAAIKAGGSWEQYVPHAVARFIKNKNG